MDRSFIANLVRLACEGAGAFGSTLYVVDGEVLKPYVVYNLPQTYIQGIGTVRIGTQCCGRAVEQKKPWIVSNMLTDPLFADGMGGALASPIRAAFSVPVLHENGALASLACHYIAPRTPTNVDIERNETFAKLIAVALHGPLMNPLPEPLFQPAVGRYLT